jgi:hypothetical protein
VANSSNSTLTVYLRTATGDAAPIRTLGGPATGVNGPGGVVVDVVNDELLVTNTGNNTVTVYPRTGDGDVAPIRTVGGSATGLSAARGLAITTLVTFADVPTTHPFFEMIEALAEEGITGGCSQTPQLYCPNAGVTRGQMAVFLERGIHGSEFEPPPAVGMFADVPTNNNLAAWIEQLFADRITTGCGQNPARYCPDQTVTREQMAVFLLRSRHGGDYQPPAATGRFADVPVDDPFAPWIEQLALEGITTGCGSNPDRYCPDQPVTRGQMAVFLVRTFDLPL